MSQRSFIRSFHLFVRSFIYSFILLYFVRSFRFFFICFVSFVSVDRSFCSLCRSFMSYLFVHAFRSFRFVRSRFIHLFFYVPVASRSIFIFFPFFPELFILSLEHLSVVVVVG